MLQTISEEDDKRAKRKAATYTFIAVWAIITAIAVSVSLMTSSGCANGDGIVEMVTDPNTIQAVGDAAKTIGIATGQPELIAIGVVAGGIALAIRQMRKGRKDG